VFPMLMAWAMFSALGFGVMEGLACGSALASTGIGFTLSLMKDMDILQTPLGQLVCAAAMIDDVSSMVLLAILKGATSLVETGEVKWRWTSPEASDVKPLFFLEDDSVLVLLRTVKWGGEHYAEEGGASISLLRLSGEDGRTLWTVSSTGFNTVFEHTHVHD